MHARASGGGTKADVDGVDFVLPDRNHRLASVRLAHELADFEVELVRDRADWHLRLLRPPVDRMEYLFDVEDHNGNRTTVTDPTNPLRATGAFGDKSVVCFPEYREPDWLDVPQIDADESALEFDAPLLSDTISATLWSPRSLTGGAPLLVVHDGPEYAKLGGLTRYLAAGVADSSLPPMRALLLEPGDRNAWYSADPAYARELVERVLPAVDRMAPGTFRVGLGVSLGALAMLHSHCSHPTLFAGLLLQSGSFFTRELDGQESAFSGFAAVTRFVASIATGRVSGRPIPITMTCGVPEENLANNSAMAKSLLGLGYQVQLTEVRDAHNFTAWRDALHPQLTRLITSLAANYAA